MCESPCEKQKSAKSLWPGRDKMEQRYNAVFKCASPVKLQGRKAFKLLTKELFKKKKKKQPDYCLND